MILSDLNGMLCGDSESGYIDGMDEMVPTIITDYHCIVGSAHEDNHRQRV